MPIQKGTLNYYMLLKKQVIEPILKKNGFKKNGVVWIRQLENKIVHIVEISNRTVVVNDFLLGVHFGVYFEGIIELSFGFPFNIRHGIGNCFWIGAFKKKVINQLWDSKKYDSLESLSADVKNSMETEILPFLNTIQDYNDVKGLFSDEFVNELIKVDSVRALQLACFYYLIGNQKEGIELVESVIKVSKLKYEFAEKILERMNS
jgi:hypothetical protein